MIVIDVGNTNIVFGVYNNQKLIKIFRVNTEKDVTKKNILLNNFLKSKSNSENIYNARIVK